VVWMEWDSPTNGVPRLWRSEDSMRNRSQACRPGLTFSGPTGLERKGTQARMPVLLELELEGELDGAGAADLVEGVEARIIGTGQAAG